MSEETRRRVWAAVVEVGYSIIVCDTNEDERRSMDVLSQLRAQRVAGIILTPIGHSPAFLKLLEGRDLPPLVTIDQRVRGLARDYVGVDNRAASKIVTEYLLRLGHRRIAFIAGDSCARLVDVAEAAAS